MATPERRIELGRRALERWAGGEVDQTLAMLTDDVEVVIPVELGNPGTYRGKEEFLRWAIAWEEVWSEFDYEIRQVVPVGERHIVIEVHNAGRGRGSGIEVERDIAWVLGLRDELCEFFSLQSTLEDGLETARQRERDG
jgi:ketosteroid isomerase-like protein